MHYLNRLLILLTFLGIATGHAEPTADTCAVLSFDAKGGGLTQAEAELLTDRFAIEIDKLGTFTVLNRSKMKEILGELAVASSDAVDTQDKVLEKGRILAVRYMVYGSVGKLGSTYTVNSYLVDTETSKTVRSAVTDLRGSSLDDFLSQGMALNARKLAGRDLGQSTLDLQVRSAGCLVTLDGVPVQAGVHPVTGGSTHVVRAEKVGHQPFQQEVFVPEGQAVSLTIELQAVSRPAESPREIRVEPTPPAPEKDRRWWQKKTKPHNPFVR